MNFFETFPQCSLLSTVSKKNKTKTKQKKNKDDGSPFSIKRCDGYNLATFMLVLVLITRVIDRSTLHFALTRNLVY